MPGRSSSTGKLIIVVMFIGLGRAYRLGWDFEVIKYGSSHKEMGIFLWGKLTPQDTMILVWQL